nr:hypothetical protein [Eubacterium sp.]
MKKSKVLFCAYITIVFGFIILSLVFTFGKGERDRELTAFWTAWETPEGNYVDISNLPQSIEGQKYEVTKEFPANMDDKDQINLISQNVYFELSVDGKEIYSYHPGENFTGKGYGSQGHYIGVPRGAKKVTLVYQPIFPGEKSASFKDVYIGSEEAFLSEELDSRGLNLAFSCIILFFGATLFVIYIGAKGLHVTTYNVPALAVAVIMIGLWTTSSSSLLQLVIDNPLWFRYTDYLSICMVSYPMVVFFSTASQQRRKSLEYVALITAVSCTSTMVVGRFCFGKDMHEINFLNMTSIFVGLGVVVVIMVLDVRTTIKKKNFREHLMFYMGAALFVVGAIAEAVVYYLFGKAAKNGGIYLQMGMILFIILMLFSILRAMLREHISFDQQMFVNDLIQYSLSDMEAEETINHMLRYLVDELDVDRAYIFEENDHGTSDNTYEVCRKGVTPQIDKLQDLPYEDVMETWYNEFENKKSIIIEDLEEYKEVNENLYDIFAPQDIHSLVVAPLEYEGKVFGFFGVDNPPAKSLGNIKRIINLLEYFTCTLIRQRDNRKLLYKFSYVDTLTGVMNRRSLDEMIDEKIERCESYGIVMCVIGLLQAVDITHHDTIALTS